VWQQTMRPVWDKFADKIGVDIIAEAQGASN